MIAKARALATMELGLREVVIGAVLETYSDDSAAITWEVV
jgi:hypothetical protein